MRKFSIAAVLVVVPVAGAGELGLPTGFDVSVDYGSGIWHLSNASPDDYAVSINHDGNFTISGSASVANTDWTFDLEVTPTDSVPTTSGPGIAFLSSAFTVTNNNAGTQNFIVTATQAAVVFPGPTEILGSHSGNVGDNPSFGDGATLAAVAGSSMYKAQIDGSTVRTLFDDPFSVSAPPFLTNSYGPGNYGFEGGHPAVASDIRIVNEFSLTGFDNAGMTSTFVVRVPAPGAAALLSVLGIAASRRRR